MIAFLGSMSFIIFILFGIMSVMSLVRKKGTLKRNALITGISFVLLILLIALDPNDNDIETVEDNDDKQESIEAGEEVVKEEAKKKTDIKDEEEKEEKEEGEEKQDQNEDAEEDFSWDDVKDKDKIVGKSDKEFSDISKSKPTDVKNDTTGNWRKSTLSESIDIEDYALSYHDLHMKEDEVHHIINFAYNTTTWLNEMGGLLYVDIKEYVDKEEHDAKILGSGMLLKSYVIYPDGDIQELED